MARLALAAATLALLAAGLLPAAAASRPPERWVRVSVATLWVRPGVARHVDAPAGAVPADPRAWVAGMTTAQKRWLVGKLETQALYGARVYLLRTSGSWSRVAVAGQPTPRNTLGYPGWLPTRQLTEVEPAAADSVALVRRPTAWLFETQELSGRVLELSYGTRLPVAAVTDEAVEVVQVDGTHAFVRRAAVDLHETGTAWPKLGGALLVAEARRFLGLRYLWAGTSGFGLDCSGFTHLVFKALGVTIPRDAAPQATAGRRVATRSALRAGDLVLFRGSSGTIHHVGLYVGNGRMIHSPATGRPVAIVSLSAEPYRSEFAGGRRLTP
jgi:gamma-D-glutamyl-L-lysine dipeptidyl-peptidase